MPARMLRDWTDSLRVAQLNDHDEVLFVRLIQKADDYGRFHADPRLVKAACLPLRECPIEQVAASLKRMAELELVVLYESQGRPYLAILDFKQRLRQKSDSKFPAMAGCAIDWLPTREKAQNNLTPLLPFDCQSHVRHVTGTRQSGDGQTQTGGESTKISDVESQEVTPDVSHVTGACPPEARSEKREARSVYPGAVTDCNNLSREHTEIEMRLAKLAHASCGHPEVQFPSTVVLANIAELLHMGFSAEKIEAVFRWREKTPHPRKPKSPVSLTATEKFEQWHTMMVEERDGHGGQGGQPRELWQIETDLNTVKRTMEQLLDPVRYGYMESLAKLKEQAAAGEPQAVTDLAAWKRLVRRKDDLEREIREA